MLGIALTALSLSCISVESNGVHLNGQSKQVSLMTKSFSLSSLNEVQASTSGGNITISGDAAGQATIEVLGQGNNGRSYSKEEIMDILKRDYEFSVEKEGNTLKAICKRTKSGSWKNAVSISYIIHVSKNVATELRTSGGNIQLSQLKGNQNFATSGGNIKFSNLLGKIDGRTSGGNINAVNSRGDIQARTSGGNINMEQLDGNIDMRTSGGNIKGEALTGDFNVSTSGGNINLSNIGAALKANTSGGSVKVDFTFFNHPAMVTTSGGSIQLKVPNTSKMNFEIKGSSVSVGQADHIQVQMNKEKDHATGNINGGGPLLEARTSGGSVDIDFQ